MTPKEKAAAMILKYTIILEYDFVSDLKWHPPNDMDRNKRIKKDAKKCALAALEEILNSRPMITESQVECNNYWEEVKKEINAL